MVDKDTLNISAMPCEERVERCKCHEGHGGGGFEPNRLAFRVRRIPARLPKAPPSPDCLRNASDSDLGNWKIAALTCRYSLDNFKHPLGTITFVLAAFAANANIEPQA